MSPRELRLRQRIDVLLDERERLLLIIAEHNRPKSKRPYESVTRDKVIAEIQGIAEKNGRPPCCRDDWRVARRAKIAFGSWADAVETAGFDRPYPRGNQPRAIVAA